MALVDFTIGSHIITETLVGGLVLSAVLGVERLIFTLDGVRLLSLL